MSKSEYKAVFSMHGFTREISMTGAPSVTCGFPFSGGSDTSDKKSLSVYFKLASFDGETAHYIFYGWREM